MSPRWAFLAHFGDISYNVFYRGIFFIIEATNVIFCHVLSEAILYQRKPLNLNNALINSLYLEKFIFQVLVLQSIDSTIFCFNEAVVTIKHCLPDSIKADCIFARLINYNGWDGWSSVFINESLRLIQSSCFATLIHKNNFCTCTHFSLYSY